MTDKTKQVIEGLVSLSREYEGDLKRCFDQGQDAAINGANSDNCNYAIFSNEEQSQAWSKGNELGKLQKLELKRQQG